MDKSKQASIKATVKAIEQDYKSKIKDAEKKYNLVRKEAEAEAEREKALIRAWKEKLDKESKEVYQMVKQEAGEIHTRLVLDLVKNVILDVKATNLANSENAALTAEDLRRSSSIVSSASGSSPCNASSSSSSSSSNIMKEDAEIKEWVEYAASQLEMHMPKSQVRQRLLEEIASGALQRQYHAQQEANQRTVELERQVKQLQLLQHQHLQQQQQQQQQQQGQHQQPQDFPPPAYVPTGEPLGVDEADFAVYGDLKKK